MRFLKFVICFACVLALVAVPLLTSAVSIPSGVTVEKRFNISSSDLVKADVQKLSLYYYRSVGQPLGYDWVTGDESLSQTSYFVDGVSIPSDESWVQFTYSYPGVTDKAMESVLGLSSLRSVDTSKYDIWFSQKLAVDVFSWDMPSSGVASPLSVTAIPYYVSADGTSMIADNNHTFTLSSVISSIHNYGGTIYRYEVNFTGDNMIAVAAANIPSGYSLYGISYLWLWSGEMPSSGYYYLSNINVSLTGASNATTEAINSMANKISGEIANMSDEITGKLNDIADHSLDPEVPDGADDIHSYDDTESALLDSASDGFQVWDDASDGFGSALTTFTPSFMIVTKIFDGLTDVPLVDALIQFSLALGLLSFIIGLFPSVSSFAVKRENRSSKR